VISGIAEEDACHRARAELVRRGGGDVGVAEAPEDAKLVIARWRAKEQFMRRRHSCAAAWSTIDEVGGRV
jgi:hypothetical protein